jgi:hypothetical protein
MIDLNNFPLAVSTARVLHLLALKDQAKAFDNITKEKIIDQRSLSIDEVFKARKSLESYSKCMIWVNDNTLGPVGLSWAKQDHIVELKHLVERAPHVGNIPPLARLGNGNSLWQRSRLMVACI